MSEKDHKRVTPKKPAERKIIPLKQVPSDSDVIEEEMRDLFDEDRVKHQQGSSEPERD